MDRFLKSLADRINDELLDRREMSGAPFHELIEAGDPAGGLEYLASEISRALDEAAGMHDERRQLDTILDAIEAALDDLGFDRAEGAAAQRSSEEEIT